MVIVDLNKRNNSWVFHIMDWEEDIDAEYDSNRFTECVEWTVDQLANYPRVKRMAYDMWYFERKREAESFKTFWALKWV